MSKFLYSATYYKKANKESGDEESWRVLIFFVESWFRAQECADRALSGRGFEGFHLSGEVNYLGTPEEIGTFGYVEVFYL